MSGMDETIKAQLAAQDEKLESIYVSVEKTRKYLLIIMWSTVAMIVLPLLGGLLLIPTLISTYSQMSTLQF